MTIRQLADRQGTPSVLLICSNSSTRDRILTDLPDDRQETTDDRNDPNEGGANIGDDTPQPTRPE